MLRHYLLLAVKVLLRRKFFTAVSLFGIAFTLVVFVVIAAFLDHTFGPGVPETRQDRMLSVQRAVMFGRGFMMSSHAGYQLFDRYARDLPGVERMTIFSNAAAVDSFVEGRKVSVALKRTDGEFWDVFDFRFLEGRPYSRDEVAHAEPLAVITESARHRLIPAAEGGAIGATIEADGQRFRVVGVVADVSEMRFMPFGDVWVPHTTTKNPAYRDQLMGSYQAVVLATSRDAFPAIRQEFNARVQRIQLPKDVEGLVAPFETRFEGFARQMQLGSSRSPDSQAWPLILLMIALGSLLAFLPAVNLVNLNISRIMERASEIGVRKAFGASSRRLVIQFIVENVLLTGVAAVLAFGLAWVVLRGINQSGLIAHAALTINLRVFVAGAALAVAFGIASGVYPAWRMSRLHPVAALKGQTR